MSDDITRRRERLETRCRIWLYSGYGLLLAGMGILIWMPSARSFGWGLVILGIAARVMHYLDHLSLRTLRKLERYQSEHESRHPTSSQERPAGLDERP